MKPIKPEYILPLMVILLAIAVYMLVAPATSSRNDPNREIPLEGDATVTVLDPPSKMDLSIDPNYPQTLFCDYSTPIPVNYPVNTAGIEDSPFITPDGYELYFFILRS